MSPSPDLSRVLPRVLIVSRRTVRKNKFVDFVGEYHLDLIVGYGAVPVIVPRVSGVHALLDSFEPIHGVLLCEGEDIDPSLYDVDAGALSPEQLQAVRRLHPSDAAIDHEKDSIELRHARCCLERNIPFLGICRGSQVLNVACGGSSTRTSSMSWVPSPRPSATSTTTTTMGTATRCGDAPARVVRGLARRRPRRAADGEQLPPPGRAAPGAAVRADGVRAGRARRGVLRPRRIQPRRGQVHHGSPIPPGAHAQGRLRRVRLPWLRQCLPGVRPRRGRVPGEGGRRDCPRAPGRAHYVAEAEQGDGEAAQGHLPELLVRQGLVRLRWPHAAGGAARPRSRLRVPRVEHGAERAAGEAAEADGRDGAERVGVPQQPEAERQA